MQDINFDEIFSSSSNLEEIKAKCKSAYEDVQKQQGAFSCRLVEEISGKDRQIDRLQKESSHLYDRIKEGNANLSQGTISACCLGSHMTIFCSLVVFLFSQPGAAFTLSSLSILALCFLLSFIGSYFLGYLLHLIFFSGSVLKPRPGLLPALFDSLIVSAIPFALWYILSHMHPQ